MKNRFISSFVLTGLLTFSAFAQSETKEERKIRQSGITTKKMQAEVTPQQALQALKDGNARFVSGKPKNQQNYRKQVAFTAKGQAPHYAIVSCLDSRVSVDDIFDLNNGDAFNARIAGNIVNEDILGSLEFATAATGADVIVVLGHSNCGAVKGACDDVKLGNLTGLLNKIQPAVFEIGKDWKNGEKNSKNHEFVEAVGHENVELQMGVIKEKSPILKDLIDKGQVIMVGAVYDLETGKVTFIN
ncbi:carbonic anhydrase family protein [soil metagenome]